MKKVLLVVPLSTTKFGSRNAGGVDSVCQMLLEHLASVGDLEFEYRVIAFNPFNDCENSSESIKLSNNVELFYYNCKEKRNGIYLPVLLNCNMRVLQHVKKFQPDIIHSHLGVWLIGGYSVKHRLATLHAYKKICRRSQSALNDFIYERLMPKITDLIVSEYTVVGSLLKEALILDTQKKVSIVGNPIASAFLKIEKKFISPEKLRFVTCAVITRRKRIEISIDVLKNARASGIDAELIVIGPNNDKDYYSELQDKINKENLTEFVIFVGACNQQEIIEYYKSSKIGLFFSIEETFGLAPLEMIAAGLPIITSKVGIVAERFEIFSNFPSVLVLEETELNFITNKILNILNSDTNYAKKFVSDEYSVDSILNCYESIYRRL